MLMKNKILSFVGSRLEGRKGNTQRTSNLSPTNHQRYHRTWGAIFTLVMLFTFAIGQMWGAKETIFYLSTKSSGEALAVAHGGSTTISTSDYLSDLTGATSVTLKNKRSGSGSQNMVATDNNEYHLTFTHNDLCIIIKLTSELAKGDEISLTGGSNNKICFTASESRSTTYYATKSSPFVIPENHDLIGKTTLYIWRNSGNTYIKTLTISRTTSCSAPTSLTNGEKTSTSQAVTWTAGGTESAWEVLHQAKDATAPAANATPDATVTSASYTFTGLTPSTAYDWYVRAKCGDSDKSSWVQGTSFTTSSAPSANPVITGAVNEDGWGSVDPASITVTSGNTVSIVNNVLTSGGQTLTATATTATTEYTYAFVNWTGVANGDAVTANVTATANFSRTPVNYTLAWDKNAEDADALAGDYTKGTVAYGSDITKPNTPTRDGYDFLGWAETSSGDVVEVPAAMPAANKTYYAKWAADPCAEPAKVTNEIARFFVPCGLSNTKGEGSNWNVSDVEASTGDNTFSTYKFGGSLASSNWYRNTTSGLIYGKLTGNDGYIEIKLKNGKPFKADDVVYVYCNRDNASKSSVKLHNQSTGHEVTLSSTAAGVEASGSYTLVAGDIESDGSLKFFRSNSNTYVNRIIVTREPATTYTLAWDFDGGSSSATAGTDYTAGGQLEEGDPITYPANNTMSKDGYDFTGWSSSATTMPKSDLTIKAQWTEHVASSDATLSDLTVGDETVDGFAATTEEYDVVLPFGTTAVPTVAGTANDANAKSVVVTQASALPGSATVVVTAEDNSTKTYTVNFTVEESKDIEMVWKTSGTRCGGTTTGNTAIKSNNAAVSTYINQITFTNVEGSGDDGAEGTSLNVGKKAGNMLTLSAKPGYAMQAMSFYGKIESADTKLEYSLDGGSTWNDLASTSSDDACYSNVFAAEEVHTLCMRSVGNKGFWIRNMQLTMIQACTPKTIAWTAAPASEYEVGATVDPIAASANYGNVTYAASNAAITVAANGALTINSLTNDVDITASVAGGDGTTYCAAGASVAKEDIKTYYLVKFNAQNETAVTEVKYYSGDAAIALPTTPSYPGYVFQGWFDAAEGGNAVTGAITPEASMTVYAQWEAQCVGPTITTQPASANYFVGRTAAALSCAATPGVSGKALTYTWYSCDDAERTNPVELASAPTPSTAAVGTFYYYCAVTEEDCDVIRNSNVVTINVTEKDMLLLIQANHVKGKTATISGYIGGTYRKEMQDNSKLGSKGYYFGIKLASGTFQAGDRVYIHTAAGADTNGDKVRIFKSNEASAENVLVEGTEAMVSPNGDNWVTLPETTLDSLYLRRGTDTENYNKDWNPYIDIFAVYRPYPVPVLTAMTVNGSDAAITGTNVAATIASNAELASLTIVPTFMSNDPENTNGALGDWTEVSEGVYTASYVVTDKDGDTNTYTITLTRDVEIASVTISGETTVAEESQITLTATVLPDNVANKAVVWSSSDETKAVVDANGVVTGKAAGAVTITATAVADNTKFGTYDITVTGFIGTKRAYWFAYADDAAANGVTNNSAVFGGAPTGSNSGAKAITLEEGWTVNTTKKAGAPGSTGTFVVPAEYTATFYAVVKGSGSSGRYLKLKQGDNVKYTSEEFGSTDPTVLKIEGVVAGTYTIVYEGGMSNFYLYAAELNRYAISSATLESGFTLRTENKRTPEMTLVHAKAAIASQTWSIVSSTATGTTINASTGEITAGTTPGTITVQVVVEDVMGNEVTSNICTVEIVEMFERLDVTGDITWNWNAAANEENVYVSTANGLALANYIAGDDWKYISGTNNDWAYNTNNEGSYQGVGALSFYTTVPGILKISGKRISNNAVITINGTINAGTLDGNVKTLKAVYVPAGEVTIAPDEAGMRITKIEFKATADYSRPNLNPNNIGTLCWTNNAILGGATLYELAGKNENNYLVFDEVEENRLEAGKPYIFVPENGNTEIKVYNTDNATALEQDDLQAVNGMMGTFVNLSTLPVAEGGQGEGSLLWNKYIISNNHYVYVDYTNCRLGAYRAYITSLDDVAPANQEPAPTQNGAPRRRLVMGGNAPAVATDIDNIFDNDTKVQKVLINGQLFIIRGEKMYDATGRLVK